jgi:hypothetical protein
MGRLLSTAMCIVFLVLAIRITITALKFLFLIVMLALLFNAFKRR